MASRDGATVAGTDGSDFSHRERVVSQYHVSSEDASAAEVVAEESVAEATVVGDLPLSGDYSGIGGPDSVPHESEGAFEKPILGNGYSYLCDLFMAPSDEAIKSYQKTERKRLIASTKSSLSRTLFCHMLVAIILLVKLSPAILDYLDVFVLQLEELNIPKPLLWEWIWFGGSFLTFLVGKHAIKASTMGKIKIFMGVVVLFGLLPILYCLAIYYSDVYAFIFDKQSKVYQTWKSLPLGILWYLFAFVGALNVHFFELWNAYVLNGAWNLKRKKA